MPPWNIVALIVPSIDVARLGSGLHQRPDWRRRGVPIKRGADSSPKITNGGRCRTPQAMRAMITSVALDRSDRKQALHDCVLRRPELGSVRQDDRGWPARSDGVWPRASARCRRGADRASIFVWLVHAPMDDARLPQMYIIAEPLRERCRVRSPECCRELSRGGADARAKLRLGVSHLVAELQDRACDKLSKPPFDSLARPRTR